MTLSSTSGFLYLEQEQHVMAMTKEEALAEKAKPERFYPKS